MDERSINAVASILAEWNPLGTGARGYADLDGYRSEAIDILFELQLRSARRHAGRIVMEVLNRAFDLSLTLQECAAPAAKILHVLDDAQTL